VTNNPAGSGPEPSGNHNNPSSEPSRHDAPPPYAQYPYQPGQYQPGQYQPGQYQPGPYPGGYPPPPPHVYPGYSPATATPRNGLGIAALVVGILAVVSSLSVAGGILLGVVAVILGFAGRGRVKKGEANNGGVALAGIILGLLGIVAGLASIAIWMQLIKDTGAGDYFDCMSKAGQNRSAQVQCENEFRQSVENQFSVTLTPTP